MKNCPSCGQPADDSAKFCRVCGAPLENAQPFTQQSFSYGSTPQRAATKKEFLALPENAKMKKDINTSGIICYVCAGITVLVSLLLLKTPSVLIDAVLLVGLGLGVHLAKSRVCAVLLLAYAAFNTIYTLATSGKFSGYLILLAGVYAVINTFKLEKAWKAYRQSSLL